jgi:cardiolipin synthase
MLADDMIDDRPSVARGAIHDASHLASADRAFARATGAEPIDGNATRLLLNADGNYPAWLGAIRSARRSVLFESYIIDDDAVGREFADALAERARAGAVVCVVYDWMGSHRAGALWDLLRSAGAQVRGFNRPRFSSPLGWVSRDHRKTVVVDGEIGFVSGLCVSSKWLGDPSRSLEPWRDTGIELRGPAVSGLVGAFDDVWRACGGGGLPDALVAPLRQREEAGEVRVRVVAGAPNETSTYRLDLVIAGLARRYLWLTDAYFIGTAAYVQALAAAARDGVDVRLLVPGASDIPVVSAISRSGYRPLLEAGVRVYEWNGTMLHAKTAVADDFWARVGSTNLNFASWTGNYELDVAIENAAFAREMAAQYEADLERATEIVLTRRNRVRPAAPTTSPDTRRAVSGSAGRAAAGAVSVGSALGAALTNRRILGTAEAGLLARAGAGFVALAVIAALWPPVIAWPLGAVAGWLGLAWLARSFALRRGRRGRRVGERTGSESYAPNPTDRRPRDRGGSGT